MTTRYWSWNRVWRHCFVFGLGPAWDKQDRSLCVIIQLGFWVLIVGPHKPPIYNPSDSEAA